MATKNKRVESANEIISYRPKPSLSIDSKDLPAIKDWKIGKTYELVVKVKLVNLSLGDGYDDYPSESDAPKVERARFRVTNVKEK